MKSFTVRGHWWLPNAEDQRQAGVLEFSQEKGCRLSLSGQEFAVPGHLGAPIELILGRDDDGKLYSLAHCLLTQTTYGLTCAYYVHRIYEGLNARDASDLEFREAIVELSYLYEWVNISGIDQRVSPDRINVEVSYNAPEDVEVEVDGTQISITFGHRSRLKAPNPSITETVSLHVRGDVDLDFTGFVRKWLLPLLQFVDLGTGRRNFFERFRFFVRGPERTEVNCYYQQSFYEERSGTLLFADDMLFSYTRLGARFPEVLSRWFEISDEISVILGLFFRERHSPRLHLELRLLTIAQALEKYHGIRFGSEVVEKPLRKSIVRRARKTVPSEHRWWFDRPLAHAGTKSLHDRLVDLVAAREHLLSPIVRDVRKFARGATDNRNYYTHLGDPKDTTLKEHDLLWLVESLSILLQSCLLSELGFEQPDQIQMFATYSPYNWLSRNFSNAKEIFSQIGLRQ